MKVEKSTITNTTYITYVDGPSGGNFVVTLRCDTAHAERDQVIAQFKYWAYSIDIDQLNMWQQNCKE